MNTRPRVGRVFLRTNYRTTSHGFARWVSRSYVFSVFLIRVPRHGGARLAVAHTRRATLNTHPDPPRIRAMRDYLPGAFSAAFSAGPGAAAVAAEGRGISVSAARTVPSRQVNFAFTRSLSAAGRFPPGHGNFMTYA